LKKNPESIGEGIVLFRTVFREHCLSMHDVMEHVRAMLKLRAFLDDSIVRVSPPQLTCSPPRTFPVARDGKPHPRTWSTSMAPKLAPKPKAPKPLTDHERLNRTIKVTQLSSILNRMHIAVHDKMTDLQAAALVIGNAYSNAWHRHKDAVDKQARADAAEAQLVFSILTVLTSGGLSWATEFVKMGAAAGAVSRTEALENMVNTVARQGSPASGVVGALRVQAMNLKDVLARQVSKRELWTNGVSATLTAIAGEAFSALGPFWGPPAADEVVSQDPGDFKDNLFIQIYQDAVPAMHALKTLADRVSDLASNIDDPNKPWELFEKFDKVEAEGRFQDFIWQADQLAGLNDLPSEKQMTDELERYIWAIWAPGLHTVVHRRSYDFDTGMSFDGGDDDEWVALRSDVDRRFIALGIETEKETHDDANDGDRRLIKWAADYLQNVQPWIRGKKG
jgi:hypothetical protein